jgi:HEAT repeat protein
LLAAVLGGCDTMGDIDNLFSGLSPPTPAEAAAWASDLDDPENQRRGITLLSTAVWGGDEAYVRLYRLYVEEPTDPQVKAIAIRALGRWGEPSDAPRIAEYLTSPLLQVRIEAAKALQRLHDPAVSDRIWLRLVDEEEDPLVRAELAVAMAQYPGDRSFQALCAALDARELLVNLAAADSLRILTGEDFGLDRSRWLAWYAATSAPFAAEEVFLYPVFTRTITFWDRLAFWNPVIFEVPAPPRGFAEGNLRRTYDPEPFRNIGEGP